MTSYHYLALCIISILCVTPIVQSKETPDISFPLISLFHKIERLNVAEAGGEYSETLVTYSYQLKYWPIIPKSEVVRLNGKEILRGTDYAIDYAKGYISILFPIPKDSSIEIEYDIIPLKIKRFYQRELFPLKRPLTQPSETPTELEQPYKPAEIPSESATPSALRVTGTKTFSVSMGSGRSLTPDQSLRINVDGKVSENVSVIAMLSDQDLPFQPEGMTEDIEDLDQKLIRITSPHVSATLGDYEGAIGESEFVAFERALEGVMVRGDFDWGSFSVIPSAIPKGQSFSKTIQGIEGQSEYRLDADGQYIVVKAGSEIVWLNGERMRRGEDNDYVIQDYGDPTIEFTSKHLITSNDVIRVDFEYIPEDIAYKQSLYGASGKLNLLNGNGTLGLSYAVEADDKDKPYIILSEDDIRNLRNNVLNPQHKVDATGKKLTNWSKIKWNDILEQSIPNGFDTQVSGSRFGATQPKGLTGDIFEQPFTPFEGGPFPKSLAGDSLIAPKKHSVLGFDGQLNVGEHTHLMGELAFSNVDYNTFSRLDKVETSPAWKLTANSSTEKLRLNLDLRKLDAKFFPVGGTTSNRGRFRYEKQYQDEKFDDAFFMGGQIQQETPTESSADLNVQYEPISGVKLDAGLGRTSEQYEDEQFANTIHQNFKRGIDINIPNLPRFYTKYQESTTLKDGHEDYRKTRERFDITHRIGKVNLNLYDENLASVDLNPTCEERSNHFNRNRKRKERGLKAEILDFKWASLSCEYSFEEAFKKESEVSVDGRPLTFSDWTRASTAKTASVGMFSKPWTWANLSTNFSRRVFKELGRSLALPSETKTNLADVNLGFEPFSGAIDSDVSFQIDRKLATEKIEIYTNTLYGVPIQPGQGVYVKVDEYHYEIDYENGDYIKIVRTVGDKPVSAVDLRFHVRFRPSRIFSVRRRKQRQSLFLPESGRRGIRNSEFGIRNSEFGQQLEKEPKSKFSLTEFMAKSFKGEIRYDVTEQQENADQLQLYLLRNIQTKDTIFGRQSKRYRLEFSPTRLFTFRIEYSNRDSLNKRVNSREWKRKSNEWNLQASSAPVARFSLESEWEKRLSFEEMTDLGIQGNAPRIVSNIIRDERTNMLRFQYRLTDRMTLGLQGAYETEDDTDLTDDKMDTRTQSLSLENQFSYSFFGKGRVNFSYQIAYGKSKGELPLAKYNFYDGLSHEVRCRTDYRMKKFTDMILRFNYRLLATEHDKPEHRAEVEVIAEL